MIPRVNEVQSYEGVRTVFLDRDGVLNRKAPEGEYVSRWEQFDLLTGVTEAIRRLNAARLQVYVVTNQRGVALGLYSTKDIERLHTRLAEELAGHGAHIDGFFFCPHDKNECLCRKPGSGLFEQACALNPAIDFTTSVMVGDSLSDIEAGARLGMRTIFIEGEAERQKSGADRARNLAGATCSSLRDAVGLVFGDRLQDEVHARARNFG